MPDYSGQNLRRRVFEDEPEALAFADFSDADLAGATFRRCNLRGAKFDRANLHETRFDACDLTACEIVVIAPSEPTSGHQIVLTPDGVQVDCQRLQWAQLHELPERLHLSAGGKTGLRCARQWREAVLLIAAAQGWWSPPASD